MLIPLAATLGKSQKQDIIDHIGWTSQQSAERYAMFQKLQDGTTVADTLAATLGGPVSDLAAKAFLSQFH